MIPLNCDPSSPHYKVFCLVQAEAWRRFHDLITVEKINVETQTHEPEPPTPLSDESQAIEFMNGIHDTIDKIINDEGLNNSVRETIDNYLVSLDVDISDDGINEITNYVGKSLEIARGGFKIIPFREVVDWFMQTVSGKKKFTKKVLEALEAKFENKIVLSSSRLEYLKMMM